MLSEISEELLHFYCNAFDYGFVAGILFGLVVGLFCPPIVDFFIAKFSKLRKQKKENKEE